MKWYRVAFLDLKGEIRHSDEFFIQNDHIALIIADGLHDAVRDVYAGWELWQDRRCVFRYANGVAPRPPVSLANITIEIQANLLRREEVLQASRAACTRSRRLLERMNELRQIVGTRDKRFFRRGKRSV